MWGLSRKQPLVSVIVPTRNSEATVEDIKRGEERAERLGIIVVHFGHGSRTVSCLDSFVGATLWLSEHRLNVKTSILIVDNSGNLNLEGCRRLHDVEVRYFRPGRNLGYAGACYVASKLLTNATILVFSNNDIILPESALLNLLETMESLPDVGAIQPLVLVEGSSKVDSIGSTCNGIMHGFNYSNLPIKPLRKFSPKGDLKAMECFGVDGMLLMLKRKVWEEVGGWDPEFFMFNEDVLLSWKLRLRGYKNYVALSSIVYHERGGTAEGYFLKKNPVFPSYYISRNKMLSVLYVYNGVWLLIYLFASVLFEFVKNVMLSLRGRSASNLYYYLKALIFILCNRAHITSERAKVFRKFDARYFLRRGYILPLSRSLAWILTMFTALLR